MLSPPRHPESAHTRKAQTVQGFDLVFRRMFFRILEIPALVAGRPVIFP